MPEARRVRCGARSRSCRSQLAERACVGMLQEDGLLILEGVAGFWVDRRATRVEGVGGWVRRLMKSAGIYARLSRPRWLQRLVEFARISFRPSRGNHVG